MTSDSPRDLPVFDRPTTGEVGARDGEALGVAVEGRAEPVAHGEAPAPALPTLRRGVDRARFLDVFTRGEDPVAWEVTASADWVTLDATGGTDEERRVWVGADWEAHPGGRARATVTVTGAGERRAVRVVADASETTGDTVAVDGTAVVEAEAYGRRSDAERARFVESDVPGRVSGASMALEPSVFESHAPEDAPTLAYDLDLPAGEYEVDVYCLPTQALTADRDLRYAVSLGGERAVASIDPDGGEHDPEWQGNVLRGAAVETTAHAVGGGTETLTLAGLDPGLVVDRLVVRRDGERATYLGGRPTEAE